MGDSGYSPYTFRMEAIAKKYLGYDQVIKSNVFDSGV
jgi:hypothetical protein